MPYWRQRNVGERILVDEGELEEDRGEGLPAPLLLGDGLAGAARGLSRPSATRRCSETLGGPTLGDGLARHLRSAEALQRGREGLVGVVQIQDEHRRA